MPVAKALKAEQAATDATCHCRNGAAEDPLLEEERGIARSGRSQSDLAELLCAPAVSREYRYWQPGSLKVPTRVCHPAVDDIWPANV
jgi:hypothetical protein